MVIFLFCKPFNTFSKEDLEHCHYTVPTTPLLFLPLINDKTIYALLTSVCLLKYSQYRIIEFYKILKLEIELYDYNKPHS